MKKIGLLSIVLLCSCTKNTNTNVKSLTITYNLHAKLQPQEKLFIQYVTSYGVGQYQYGKLATDTLNTDSFNVTVKYNIDYLQMHGQAGYFAAAIVVYPNGGKPYLKPTYLYSNYVYHSESVIVKVIYPHNYSYTTPNRTYEFQATQSPNFKTYFTTQYAYW